ncbi:single-stranded DNA-binding protein [Sneathia vaginalis]|uniref:Single-stranded DNA-binding protein n=1 Tax=Sneathia vaginalis TaxID=187101 RepID=A0A0E3UTZ2_9FUSO|nr:MULTISPECIES: single-stranded DNA-binding protein [Sneathia]AKC95704.1 single-stranded DNA-binding protein [Sneathia vaginalis]MBE2989491.1 single-stranded DNA-binding protein [Sneathia sp. DSM 16630]MBE3031532.1 single-stranded DNA-binding protein [Sneathia sp. DSM 16631]MDK9582557.1 single-stranded DNA-binding protein [Sneathia vaginalis]
MNYVGLMGRLTRDPELKQTSSGKSYCRFSIAVKKEFVKDGVDFINCVAWDKRAEFIANYFGKGQRILVQGRINVGSYEVNGEKRNSFDVVVDRAEFIETQSNSGSSFDKNADTNDYIDTVDDPDDGEDFPF